MNANARIMSELGRHPNYAEARALIMEAIAKLDGAAKQASESATFSGRVEVAATPEIAQAMREHDEAVARHQSNPVKHPDDDAVGFDDEGNLTDAHQMRD
jgi:hypothetical protein